MPPLSAKLVVVVAVVSAAYFMPTVVAVARSHHRRLAIAAVNVFIGWTIFGWLVAYYWALTPVEHAAPDGSVDRREVSPAASCVMVLATFAACMVASQF